MFRRSRLHRGPGMIHLADEIRVSHDRASQIDRAAQQSFEIALELEVMRHYVQV